MLETIFAALVGMVNPLVVGMFVFGLLGYSRGIGAKLLAKRQVETAHRQLTDGKERVSRSEEYIKQVETERDQIAVTGASIDQLSKAMRKYPDLIPVPIIEAVIPAVIDQISPQALANLLNNNNALLSDWVIKMARDNPSVAEALFESIKDKRPPWLDDLLLKLVISKNRGLFPGVHDWGDWREHKIDTNEGPKNRNMRTCKRCGVSQVWGLDTNNVAGLWLFGQKLSHDETLKPCGFLTAPKDYLPTKSDVDEK